MKIIGLILLGFLAIGFEVRAQDSDVEELNLIEMELDRNRQPAPEDESETRQTAPNTNQLPPQLGSESRKTETSEVEEPTVASEFRQVSVLQRRYLPRTGRFQVFVGPSMILNDPWFNVYGGTLRLGYNFLEAWGIEAGYTTVSTDKTQARRELGKINDVVAQNIVYTRNYYNVDVNWTPLYGKMTWFDQKIVYYDTYFSAGFGGTEIQTGDVQSTIRVAAGQIFSISKKMAFRWDVSWNSFEARQVDASEGSFNNVFLTAGVSFFFPEASYR